MKTAVSIPDATFARIDRFARRARRSRSDVVTAAITEYLARHGSDEVTEAINRACDLIGDQSDPFVQAAVIRALEAVEWS